MSKLLDNLPQLPLRAWLVTLAVISVIERALLVLIYGPASFGDTPTYFRLTKVLMEQGLSAYDATRVPGYPLFIGLLGQQESNVWLAQLTLGVAISLMLFYIGFRLTASPSFAFLMGMLYNTVASLVLFEFNLLSETLTTFLLILSLSIFTWVSERNIDNGSYLLALLLGVIASVTGLVRTLFFFLPVILLPFVILSGQTRRQQLQLGLIFSIGPVLLLGGWIYFVYSHYDMISPTTMGGYHLVQHTGAFFEKLPESEATIRDIYIEFRDERIAERGVQTNTIWDAIPALSQATGLSFFALSAKLQDLSWMLIAENPGLYLASVIEGWISFWKAPVYWKPDLLPPNLVSPLRAFSYIGRGIAVVSNGAFLILTTAGVISRSIRHRLSPPKLVVLSAALIWFTSVLQTLVDHGDNPRFLVPLQILVIVLVSWAFWKFRRPPVRS